MESLSNQNNNDTPSSSSNVELTLLGIDKKWIFSNGSWIDKSKAQTIETKSFDHIIEEKQPLISHWWQFWKA